MAKAKITLSIDEDLLRRVRVRAARTGRTRSDVLEEALRQGLDVIERIRASARLPEERALDLASEVVHEIRARR
jgi:plasmid stability protein